MRIRFWATAAAAGVLAFCGQARAAVVVYTYEGKLTAGEDATGVFGQAGEDLTGLAFTAVFTRDDATPGAQISLGAEASSISGTGAPPVRATLTINGVTRAIGGNLGSQSQRYAPNCFGSTCFPEGSWDHQVESFGRGFDPVAFTLSTELSLLDIRGLDAFGRYLPGPDYHTLPSAMFGNVTMSGEFKIIDSVQDVLSQRIISADNAFGDLFPLSLTVTTEGAPAAADVPEPAEWMLLIAGMAGIGGALRRARGSRARAGRGGAVTA